MRKNVRTLDAPSVDEARGQLQSQGYTVLASHLGAGEHRVQWDRLDAVGRPCPSGLYFLHLRAGGEVQSAKILVTR